MDDTRSTLEKARSSYEPRVPETLRAAPGAVSFRAGAATVAVGDTEEIRRRFPHTFGRPTLTLVEGGDGIPVRPLRVGIVLSGGQAPGGHNVIAGLLDGVRTVHGDSRLYGFLGGPKGIMTGRHTELTLDVVDPYRNTGGFDMIGSGRDKIETGEQFEACAATARRLELDGLVVAGGDDSNTNAAMLAEHFLAGDVPTAVVGVPKTIDGDLRGPGVECSFGFDTATKTYAELIGNICRDAKSAGKYWHVIKLMGRSASHVTLECALATHPNVALIGEEVRRDGTTLDELVDRVADVVRRRAADGRRYGVCLVPEGLIEFIPEMGRLIASLNAILGRTPGAGVEAVAAALDDGERRLLESLPQAIRRQLMLDRDSHGNVQVSKIDTEALITAKLAERIEGLDIQRHFFGYEGRCAAPSNFDADYTYALGRVAALLVAGGHTGTMSSVAGLAGAPSGRAAGGVPLTAMMQIETRKGRPTPVIAKALVDLEGPPFRTFAAARDAWAFDDAYLYPGAIQYFGPAEVCDAPPVTLRIEHGAS